MIIWQRLFDNDYLTFKIIYTLYNISLDIYFISITLFKNNLIYYNEILLTIYSGNFKYIIYNILYIIYYI